MMLETYISPAAKSGSWLTAGYELDLLFDRPRLLGGLQTAAALLLLFGLVGLAVVLQVLEVVRVDDFDDDLHRGLCPLERFVDERGFRVAHV